MVLFELGALPVDEGFVQVKQGFSQLDEQGAVGVVHGSTGAILSANGWPLDV